MADCLDIETTNNIIKWGNVAAHPMSIMTNIANVQEDFNLFAEAAEIYGERLGRCLVDREFGKEEYSAQKRTRSAQDSKNF